MKRDSPRPPRPELIRRPAGSFGWLDARLLHDGRLGRLGPERIAALTLLALAAPRTPRQRLTWAELLKRVFAIDVLACPHCGGPRKLIALINDGLVVRKLLGHLGLATEPPPMAPARAPPEPEFSW